MKLRIARSLAIIALLSFTALSAHAQEVPQYGQGPGVQHATTLPRTGDGMSDDGKPLPWLLVVAPGTAAVLSVAFLVGWYGPLLLRARPTWGGTPATRCPACGWASDKGHWSACEAAR